MISYCKLNNNFKIAWCCAAIPTLGLSPVLQAAFYSELKSQ
ncbi:hypothetical protein HMPREF9098_2217 [Kingella denitrificans ATCC 33394]|uniref:Uncharacterized protein n=1 Tax=Kingella denitrificans ATCC 33394 TaxID=888741 RepID=F0F282_9NEIS|nr:hypothetical protein HMPREF9098_2217 [Kingella denitrificans ATCC 33394]